MVLIMLRQMQPMPIRQRQRQRDTELKYANLGMSTAHLPDLCPLLVQLVDLRHSLLFLTKDKALQYAWSSTACCQRRRFAAEAGNAVKSRHSQRNEYEPQNTHLMCNLVLQTADLLIQL